MKLLRDFVRRFHTGIRAATGRGVVARGGFSVTVPAPLAHRAGDSAVVIPLPSRPTTPQRHEPSSSLQARRHLKLVSSR